MKPTFGSAFAGIGGFELGLERAGWHCRWQIENDKFCNKILKKHWPDVGRWLDVRDFEPRPYEEWAVDLICGGFPCQDLSVAGKRGGLSGERSGLFWELVRLARELQPRWLLIENVPGFLSSNEGEDFALALEMLAECGYGLAWRVLDSQYFGVPQRRRRVFIVGHFGAICPPEILFESEGGEGDIAEGGKAGEDIAYCLRERPSHSGDKGDGGVNTTLVPTVGALQARDYKGVGTQYVEEGKLIAGFSAGQSAEAGSIAYEEERSPTLKGEPSGTNQVPSIVSYKKRGGFGWSEAEDRTGSLEHEGGSHRGGPERVPLVIEENTRDELRIRQSPPTVSARPGGKQKPWVVQTAFTEANANKKWWRDRTPPLDTSQSFAVVDGEEADPNGVREASGVPRRVDLPVLGFRNLEVQRDIVGTLIGQGDASRKAGINDLPIVFDWRSGGDVRLNISEEQTSPLHSPQAPAVMTREQAGQEMMRRIKHCFTCPDSPRYRALGNAVTVQVAEWIGRRILEYENP